MAELKEQIEAVDVQPESDIISSEASSDESISDDSLSHIEDEQIRELKVYFLVMCIDQLIGPVEATRAQTGTERAKIKETFAS